MLDDDGRVMTLMAMMITPLPTYHSRPPAND
jgi:hypothetical protein